MCVYIFLIKTFSRYLSDKQTALLKAFAETLSSRNGTVDGVTKTNNGESNEVSPMNSQRRQYFGQIISIIYCILNCISILIYPNEHYYITQSNK